MWQITVHVKTIVDGKMPEIVEHWTLVTNYVWMTVSPAQ
jgi:hypothetical protein